MNLLRDAPVWVQIILAALLVAAAAQDVVQRRISNWLCLGVIIAAVAAAIAVGPTWALWQNGLVFLILLGLGTGLFAVGWLGGGDVKLLAALGLWVNLAAALPLVAIILISGGVLALLSILVRGGKGIRKSKGIPYGVAVAVGAGIILLKPNLLQPQPKASNPLDLKAARQAD